MQAARWTHQSTFALVTRPLDMTTTTAGSFGAMGRRASLSVWSPLGYRCQPSSSSLLGCARSPVRSIIPRRNAHWGILNKFKEVAKTPQQLALKEELERGYWGDANELLGNKEGKLFKAPHALIPKASATKLLQDIPSSLYTYKPFSFKKVDLKEEMHKKSPTLVLVTCKRMFTTHMIDSWRRPFEAKFPHLNCYEIELVQQVGYWLVGGLFRLFAVREIEPGRVEKVLYYNGISKTQRMRLNLSIKNRLCAFAFLCDKDGLSRWNAVGVANEEELELLQKMVERLEKEERPAHQPHQRN